MEELVVRGLVALLAAAVGVFIVATGHKAKDVKLSLGGIGMLAATFGMMALPLPA